MLKAEDFDINNIKSMVENCAEDEIVILLPHASINFPYNEEEWEKLEELIEWPIQIGDYDDLIIDIHGIIN